MTAFIDARDEALPDLIQGSICVVGAGAAGITLARTLAKTTQGVILIESGGMDIDGQTQSLYAGRQLGLPYFNLTACRLRYFGGTTNHWSGYCRPNDPLDYEGRPELGLPAWPITAEDLAPYVTEAAESLGIDSAYFDPATLVQSKGLDPALLVDAPGSPLQTKIFQLAKDIRLGPKFAEPLANEANLQVFTNLNVTHVQLSEDGRQVSHLEAATINGQKYRVEARYVVLCCHAIENARLMLASDDVMSSGVGNSRDHVGRYFMEHTHMHASRFIPSENFPEIYNRFFGRRRNMNANLSFTDAFTREQGLLQYYCRFNPHYFEPETGEALDDMLSSMKKPGDLDFLADVARVTSELRGAIGFELTRRNIRYTHPAYYELEHRLEQAPNPDSRVVLSDRRDSIGNRIADLDWRLNEVDIRSFKEGQAAMGQELSALGFGRIEEEEITRDLVEDRVEGHYHHIGTTRMSAAAADGVVNADCRVHGVENLYVGGSSVFPTAGYSGPTMMIVAMALRLSEHLKTRAL